jgi:hypothetical protein
MMTTTVDESLNTPATDAYSSDDANILANDNEPTPACHKECVLLVFRTRISKKSSAVRQRAV